MDMHHLSTRSSSLFFFPAAMSMSPPVNEVFLAQDLLLVQDFLVVDAHPATLQPNCNLLHPLSDHPLCCNLRPST